jgi:hypothetical protein
MRGVCVTVLVTAVLAAATPASLDAKSTGQPTVRIAQLSPLVVRGERFRAAQRVVIRVTAASETRVRTMRTTPSGAFVARFSAVTVDRCSGGVSVVVTAADGRVAKTRRPDLLCPPAIP